jgi:hypothetical protein
MTTHAQREHERLRQELAALRRDWQIGQAYLADCVEAIAALGAVREVLAAREAAVDQLVRIRRDLLIVFGERLQKD